jgi:hexosaminidase
MQLTTMNKLFSLAMVLVILTSCGQKESRKVPEPVSIVPRPASLTVGEERLALPSKVEVVANTEDEKNVAALLQEFLKSRNTEVSVVSKSEEDVHITVLTGQDTAARKENYSLSIDGTGVTIQAASGAGLFYGVQSLIQLFPSEGADNDLPFVSISDAPRFVYRGMHLDVGRHMFPVAFIKKYIDLLSRHKFNTFHWHLTEDQGWRIEIKKYPKLQEISAYRKETLVGHYGSDKYDGKRYGGYYTQEEVKEVVDYAAERYVTVIPEIEMPGHSVAALAAYPNLGCTGGPYEVRTTWAVADDVYCAGKEETFAFLEDVLDEVIALFPGKYIHIGGDECPKTRWKACPHCQKRIKAEKLKDEHELQSYFIQRMEKYLNSKGKQIIGWDEILEGGLAPNATVMSWRGEEGGIAAAKQNHNVIMTPGNWCYFDNYQDTSKTEPLAIGGFTPVKEVYEYEPLPPQLIGKEADYVLGAQGNVWTEYMATSDYVEYMVYPRACALAEVLWSPRETRNYDDFLKRMQVHRKRLGKWGVNYATHMFGGAGEATPAQPE